MARKKSSLILCVLLVIGFSMNQEAVAQKAEPFQALSGYVVDERFSALRREPSVKGPIIERFRLGRFVAVLKEKRVSDGVTFVRVAPTRRTRGWLPELAVALPAKAGDDRRLLGLVEAADGFARLHLAHIFVAHFDRSPLRPKALLILGQEAEAAAQGLSDQAGRRLGANSSDAPLSKRHLALSFDGLDRYNRLGVLFDYDESGNKYVYDGWAYREILARYAKSDEAMRAAERLERSAKK
jgi:hypothetical protein